MTLKIKNLLLLVFSVVILYLLFFRREQVPPIKKEIKVVEKLIQGKTETIEIIKYKTIEKLKIVKEIHNSIDTIRINLLTLTDTAEIIQVQRVLIDTLTHENNLLYNVINLQDSTIQHQDERDSLRVVQIDVLTQNNKKTKRRLIFSGVLNVIQSALLIFKK